MSTNGLINNPQYKPNALLDWVMERLQLKNDARLADALDVMPPAISKLRNRRMPIGPSILLKIHDLTDTPARELRKIAGIEQAA